MKTKQKKIIKDINEARYDVKFIGNICHVCKRPIRESCVYAGMNQYHRSCFDKTELGKKIQRDFAKAYESFLSLPLTPFSPITETLKLRKPTKLELKRQMQLVRSVGAVAPETVEVPRVWLESLAAHAVRADMDITKWNKAIRLPTSIHILAGYCSSASTIL